VLTHDFGKAATPADILPGHHGHEKRGVELVRSFCERWKVPKASRELALMTCEFHTHIHRAYEMTPSTLLKFFMQCDVFRRSQRFYQMTDACVADVRGRTGFEDDPYPQAGYAKRLVEQLCGLDLSAITSSRIDGKKMAEAIYNYRLDFLKTIIETAPAEAG
jgi:tRNA nucleotidyltransferase (CCA-adding enzyme)